MTSGIERIAEAFARARAEGRRAALMPYMMGGYPDLDRARSIADAYVRAGADLVELGVPFSDPLADGPVIHAASTAALAAGVTVPAVLELCRRARARCAGGAHVLREPHPGPGTERFLDALLDAGASGLIVPDLPLEESERMREHCDARGLALVPLVAPTTPPQRAAQIGAGARGFLYVVALTGTTGERVSLDGQLGALVARAGVHAGVPVAVGFGISSPEQAAAAAAAGADGVIVGSRLVRLAGEAADPGLAVERAVRELAQALR